MSIINKNGKTFVYPIDEYCTTKGEIFVDKDDVYSCTLNQTDIKTNKNKYYIMQIIKSNSSYIFFIRYGRLGDKGKIAETKYANAASAMSEFAKQFRSKTGNNWRTRNTNFVKKDKKYFLSDVAYETTQDVLTIKKDNVDIKSNLDLRVQNLMSLISDVETMNKTLIQLDINPKKMPLGKISNEQLQKAKLLINEISKIVSKDKMTDDDKEKIIYMSSEFYTYVPYSCGRKIPPVIENSELVSKFDDMIDELKNLVVAVKIASDVKSQTDKHPTDAVYETLKTTIKPLDKSSDMWKYIEDYVTNTHAKTHKYKTELVDIYEIEREGEKDKYMKYSKDIGNKMLLWHGSRMANFCSILSKGLYLNPESLGVHITGKMFGSGIYLADSFSKSFNYCAIETSNNIACLLLNEVSLGNMSKRVNADYYISKKSLEKEKCQSTMGVGMSTPESHVVVDNDVVIPNGKLVPSKVKNATLLYNEYIIYDIGQILLKYMVIVKKV